MTALRRILLPALVLAALAAVFTGSGQSASRPHAGYVPPIRHVFVINIENKGYDETWGAGSKAPYLARTLRRQGVLLNSYYGTAHNSQANYIAQISGQGPNPQMQADCQIYSQFVAVGRVSPGQYLGTGCVFGRNVVTLPQQLNRHGFSWKGYMQGMGGSCVHPKLNSVDGTQKATVGHQYAVRHNPFVYFRWITDSARCDRNVVGLRYLSRDLRRIRTTPNYSYITPDLCSDGHDAPCVDGRPGGLASVNVFLKHWVPKILASPAFQRDGMLIITADESDGPQSDASACCGEGPSANSPLPGITGMGGGRIGALVISPWTRPRTWSTTPYNHYSMLASVEDIFGLARLGYAGAPGLNRFGLDVYNDYR